MIAIQGLDLLRISICIKMYNTYDFDDSRGLHEGPFESTLDVALVYDDFNRCASAKRLIDRLCAKSGCQLKLWHWNLRNLDNSKELAMAYNELENAGMIVAAIDRDTDRLKAFVKWMESWEMIGLGKKAFVALLNRSGGIDRKKESQPALKQLVKLSQRTGMALFVHDLCTGSVEIAIV